MEFRSRRRFRVRVKRNRTFQRTDGVSVSAGHEIVLSEHQAAWAVRNRVVEIVCVEKGQTRDSPAGH